ncbi:MAG: hypothetical protein O6761_06950 [Thaumarchaeota archaeon]|nr:hypothetical protein [Nitrososphaerota archaeon]
MQQYKQPKLKLQDKNFRNIYGIDLASKDDFFAVVLNQLPPYDGDIYKDDPSSYLPRLRTLRQYHRTDYPKMLRMLRGELFSRFPPFYIVIDYTSEKTFTDFLVESYKDDRVEKINFNIGSKKMLKEDGLNLMSQGYQFPNVEQIPSGPSTDQVKEWFRIMDMQLRHEQIITTRSNKISFNHPEGEHNDLAIAWELSAHGCLRFMLKPVVGIHVRSSNGRQQRKESIENINSLFPELDKPGIRTTSVVGIDPKHFKKSFKTKRGF